nr:MAG TPA: hypothetical protein [Bacteriophage sp.]
MTYGVGTVFLQMGRLTNKTRVNKSKEFESLNLTLDFIKCYWQIAAKN